MLAVAGPLRSVDDISRRGDDPPPAGWTEAFGFSLDPAGRVRPGTLALVVGLDGLSEIRHGLGARSAERILGALVPRLVSAVGEGATVLRLAGDELLVVSPQSARAADGADLSRRLVELASDAVEVGGGLHRLSARVGSALASAGRAVDPDELIEDAFIALGEARRSTTPHAVAFRQEMRDAARRRVELIRDLDGVVDRGGLHLLYQPTVDVVTGAMVGAEALLRWQHPRFGPVGPAEFVPLAERHGHIGVIGGFALAAACRQATQWPRDRDRRHRSVAVNVSACQLSDVRFTQNVAAVLAESDLAPEALVLEITESVLMDDRSQAADRIHELRSMGVRIALDDFGTGYSSLARLMSVPVDVIKIDRFFISEAAAGHRVARALVTRVVQLCDDLGTETVAEGIETPSEANFVREAGCHLAQGYLTGRPMSGDAVARLFRAQAGGPGGGVRP